MPKSINIAVLPISFFGLLTYLLFVVSITFVQIIYMSLSLQLNLGPRRNRGGRTKQSNHTLTRKVLAGSTLKHASVKITSISTYDSVVLSFHLCSVWDQDLAGCDKLLYDTKNTFLDVDGCLPMRAPTAAKLELCEASLKPITELGHPTRCLWPLPIRTIVVS